MKLVVALALGLTFVGCAKEEEEPKVDAPSSLFAATDLEAGNVYQLSSTNLSYAVSEAAYMAAPKDATSASLDEEDPSKVCLDGKLAALTYSADMANAKVEATIDVKDCKLFDQEGDPAVTYNTAEIKVLSWFGCKNDDIEDLDGVTIESTQDKDQALPYCKSEEDVQVMANLDANFDMSRTNDDGDLETSKVRIIEAMQTKEGDPCAATYADNNWTWSDGCVVVSRVTFGSTEEYSSASFVSIVQSHDPQLWFQSGHVDVKINNWTGKITYAGANTVPTWELTDGSTTQTGTVGEFGLTGGSLASAISNSKSRIFSKQ